MGKNNTPFNKNVFNINAIDTAKVTVNNDLFSFFVMPIRFNTNTASNFKLTTLPKNEKNYTPALGGLMKILNISNKDDVDRYFVPDDNNNLYSSILELINGNSINNVGMKIFLLDLEDEVVTTAVPNFTNILQYIHKSDITSLPVKKLTLAKDQIHSTGYMIKGFPLLGIGETVDPTVASKLTPDMLSLNLLSKPANTPILPVNLFPVDKAEILQSNIIIDYNVQSNKDLVFEILKGGVSVVKADIDPAEVTKIEASDVIMKYKKTNNTDVTVTISPMTIVDAPTGQKATLTAPTTKLIDFDQSRVVSVIFSDNTIDSQYTTLVDSAPSSVEYSELFSVRQVVDATDVKVIIGNDLATLLTTADQVVAVSFDNKADLQNRFGFLFGEKANTPISGDVLKYLYVKLAEINIAKDYGSSVNECQSIIDLASTFVVGGTIFSYNAVVQENGYDILKAEADGHPINPRRDYYCEAQANKVVDLTVQETLSVSLAAIGNFYSVSETGTINYAVNLSSHRVVFSDKVAAKLNLPKIDNNDTLLPHQELSQLIPVNTDGILYYYSTNDVSLVKTSGFYNTSKDLITKAYTFYAFNTKLTSIMVRFDINSYTPDMVDKLNEGLNTAASNVLTVFGSGISLVINEVTYYSNQPNPYLITNVVDNVRVVTFNLGNIASLIIPSLVDKYDITFTRQIGA